MNYQSLGTCKRKNVGLLLIVLGTVLVVYYYYGNIQHQQLLLIRFFSNDMQNSLVEDIDGITPTFTIPIPTEEPSFVPGIGRCEDCLAGRQLISVHPNWICGGPRIGNKMFMLASAISLADSWNATFVLPKPNKSCQWMEWLQDIFCTMTTTVPLLPAHVMKKWPHLSESTFSEFRHPDHTSNNLTITGFKQSWKYFEKPSNWEAVKKTFQFSKKYKLIAERNLNVAQAQFNITDPLFVGVHIRLGDLISDRSRHSYGYVVANSSFYELAFETAEQYLGGNNGSIIFVVASDTLDVAKQMLDDLNEFYDIFFTHGSDFEDLTTLCTCNHSIISGGTYGFWAAKLAGGLTFYHPYFARPGSQFDKDFNRDNFYLPEWIPVYWKPAIDNKLL